MDIFQALKHDHEEIMKMFGEIESAPDIRRKKQVFDKLAGELRSHIKLEERFFYKMMLDDSQLRDMILEGYEEHALVSKLLRDIPRSADGDKWKARVMVMRHMIEDHVKKEEKQMFRMAKAGMDRATAQEIGGKYEQQHEKMAA